MGLFAEVIRGIRRGSACAGRLGGVTGRPQVGAGGDETAAASALLEAPPFHGFALATRDAAPFAAARGAVIDPWTA